jgi:hypothetical protein
MEPSLKRTEWAERHVEEFLSQPFIREFVFRSLQKLDPTQKEVVDLMVMHRNSGILISQKAQENPLARTAEKNKLWVRKKAKEAASQLTGAIRSGNEKPIWCEHRRRGRVEFPQGLPPIEHGLVLIETRYSVDLQPDADELPLDYAGVPITYLSVNDFMNLVQELRTVPELLAYLDARRAIPLSSQRVVGDDMCLFEFYLLEGGTLNGCVGHADAKLVVATRQGELNKILRRKAEQDYCNGLMEHVADSLATRHRDYARDLRPEILAAFDAQDDRKKYMVIQEVVADLRLSERASLGRALLAAINKVGGQAQGFTYQAAYFDSRDWVFLLCASKGTHRPEVLNRMGLLARGALTFYKKANCMVVIDRDGESYEIGVSRPDFEPTPFDLALGDQYFARLRVTVAPLSIV